MIKKILLEETEITGTTLEMDFLTKTCKRIKENIIIENQINVNPFELDSIISGYVTYWKNSYIGKDKIDGIRSTLKIETTEETLEYTFEGEFPEGYGELIDRLKKIAGAS